MRSHEMPVAACPRCGHRLNGATNADPREDEAPDPGDLTVCASCEAFLTYGPDMGLVALSKREVAELLPAERTNLVRARDLVRLAKRIPDLPRPAGRAREDR